MMILNLKWDLRIFLANLLPASISQSCLSRPSVFFTSSGAKGRTCLLSGCISAAWTILCSYHTFPFFVSFLIKHHRKSTHQHIMHFMLDFRLLTKIRDFQKPSRKHLSQRAETQIFLCMHTEIPGGLLSAAAYNRLCFHTSSMAYIGQKV